jgi:hypothetical protein
LEECTAFTFGDCRVSKRTSCKQSAAAKVATRQTNGTAYQNARKSIHIKGAAYFLSDDPIEPDATTGIFNYADSPAMYCLVESVFLHFNMKEEL